MLDFLKNIFKSRTVTTTTYNPPSARYIDFSVAATNPEVKKIWNAAWWKTKHNEPDFFWRRQRSFETLSIHIDQDTLTGSFLGSEGEVYDTSLTQCTCMDYIKSKQPCKHIYRLFYCLENNINLNKDSGLKNAMLVQALKESNRVSKNANITYKRICEIIKAETQYYCFLSSRKSQFNNFDVIDDVEFNTLSENNLIRINPDKDYHFILSKLTKDDLFLLLFKKSIDGFKKSWTKQQLVNWIIDNHTDMLEKRFSRLIRIDIS